MSVGRFLQQAAAGNAGGAVYVDDVFSTYLYDGTGSAQTITNGIDLSGKGGLVWIKGRGPNAFNHILEDTVRGADRYLRTNTANTELIGGGGVTAFNSDGFTTGTNGAVTASGNKFASWTFRKQRGFFDVVTYTGNGSSGVTRTLSHNLGSVPGMIIVKNTTQTSNWAVYHRGVDSSSPENYNLYLDATNGRATSDLFGSTAPTDTEFTVGWDSDVNANGQGYVAYLFAHDAQDFGTDSDESIIKCGSYTGNGSTTGPVIDLGFEPQWVMIKNISFANDWWIFDSMRGITSGGADSSLRANLSSAENTGTNALKVTATGFQLENSGGDYNGSTQQYIYVAIRRPHKPAEEFAATDLFDVIARSGTGSATTIDNINFAPDAFLTKRRNDTQHWPFSARLTGNNYIYLSDSAAEGTGKHINGSNGWGYQDKVAVTSDADVNASGGTYINYFFKRAKGFFDVVTYTGNGSTQTINHNLGVVPEIILFRGRAAEAWWLYSAEMAATEFLVPYLTNTKYTGQTYFDSTRPTASSWTVKGPSSAVNGNGNKYIAYLFASVPGISKFGSYTGNGTTTNNIDCGFSSGARFVVVKRTDSSGNWYVWDTERGIVAGNDPKLYFSSTGSEITSADEIDPYSAGFTISSSSTALNASGGNYIFLAIA